MASAFCTLVSAASELRSTFSKLTSCSPRTETRPRRRRSSSALRAGPLSTSAAAGAGEAGFGALDEVPLLLAAVPDPWRAVSATAVYTGLRKGELFGLRKTDVDLANRTITICRSYDRETTKGGHADAIPIAEALVPFLEEAINLLPPSPFAASLLQDPRSTPSGTQTVALDHSENQELELERETGFEPATLSLGS